ncbi:putative prolyl 4-hydroxylase 7 [Asimina triloba]
MGDFRFYSYLRLKKSDVRPSSAAFDTRRVTQLSWRPSLDFPILEDSLSRASLYSGFLNDAECNHLINLARDKLEKSTVADNDSGESIMSEERTSSGMFLIRKQDEIVSRIEGRIAAWTLLPEENGESIQILHYEHGEKYEPHYDYFYDKANQEIGGHRIATVLMYLSSVEMGGETIFPNSELKDSQLKDDTWSECARDGFAVKPKKGDALLFFSLHPNASTDADSLHGSCPVIKGEKWSATKWIHVKSYDLSVKKHESSEDCVDEHEFCSDWAAEGQCLKNSLYMVGSPTSNGICRKSCKKNDLKFEVVFLIRME